MPVLPVIRPPTTEVPTCCGPSPAKDACGPTKFHFALNVSDLERSVAFYEKLFSVAPAKHHHDYAKFEVDQPPLVFSLVPSAPASGGSLYYLGLPVASCDEVEAVARRFANAAHSVVRRQATNGGSEERDRVWVSDPDNNEWEIYVVRANDSPPGISVGRERRSNADGGQLPTRRIWEHRVTDDMPNRIPYDDNSVDEIRLTGTFNSHFAVADRRHLLLEAIRVLKEGGEVKVHGLVASLPLAGGLPNLPGVASLVRRVPTEIEPLSELRAAGFVQLHVTKLSESAVFSHGPAEMREIKLTANKPPKTSTMTQRVVTYNGPFDEVTDDAGGVYRRGVPTAVARGDWEPSANAAAAMQVSSIGEKAGSCVRKQVSA